MAAIFLDSSALVRRYDRSESGASRVRAMCAPSAKHTLLVARFASVEVASALARKAREGALHSADRSRLWRLFRVHWRDQYQVVAVTEEVYAHAERLLFRAPLRGLDALHLGCAAVVAARLPHIGLEFWTADMQQARAAEAEGFAVELVT
jgi:predicted nucleic acid-binding protein